MIKVEVIDDFSLEKFHELKNIQRKSRNEEGRLYRGDVFECTEGMADYLQGNNRLNRAFVKIIEIIPEKIKKQTKSKKTIAKK